MNSTSTFRLQVGAVSVLLLGSAGPGMAQDPDQNLHDWQVRRLMQPLPHELKKELDGSVYIYDGLTEKEVEVALDAHFGRVQHMMFIGTKKTDSRGELLRDAQTGQVMQESGGCSTPD
ncbi:MAG: hypothetical protein R6W97_03870 [Thiobacillus sp.]